nr:LysR substrate-binding domain-containing protein [Afipia sp. GAS231]
MTLENSPSKVPATDQQPLHLRGIWLESFAAMREVVRASDAISWAPVPLLEPYWRRGELAHLVMKPAPIDIEFGLIYQRHRTPAPAVTAFIEIISAIAANRPVPRNLTGK